MSIGMSFKIDKTAGFPLAAPLATWMAGDVVVLNVWIRRQDCGPMDGWTLSWGVPGLSSSPRECTSWLADQHTVLLDQHGSTKQLEVCGIIIWRSDCKEIDSNMSSGAAADGAGGEGEAPGEATLLVSEFPPPPFYYTEAATLTPPKIPKEALERGTRRAEAAAARARAEAERLRLADGSSNTAAILGGVTNEEEEGDVVGVFGEIVEDPMMVNPIDPCEDPTVIRDEVKRLNERVVQGFVSLVQDLVQRPAENKIRREELTHNIFLMLQETNKFREHQAREILIEILEKQLKEREMLLKELEKGISDADALLGDSSDVMDES